MQDSATIDLQPQAGYFLESIRNVGYTFNTAIADIIDNSITASAKHIAIFRGNIPIDAHPSLYIADDGCGMSDKELTQAMRFAPNRELFAQRDPFDLGRFGLGLKLATLSQARQLLVVSRRRGHAQAAASWDIDFVKNHNTWSLQVLTEEALEALLQQYGFLKHYKLWFSEHSTGTIVFWLRIDKISPDDVDTQFVQLKRQLELIFHRFLERGTDLRLNGSKLKPCNPFLKDAFHTVSLSPLAQGALKVSPHVLPYMTWLSDEEWCTLGITANKKSQSLKSGFYIYRADRLIIWGGWFGFAPNFPSKKIVRVELDVSPNEDELWGLDVRKSRVQIPEDYHAFITNCIRQALNVSLTTYTRLSNPTDGNSQEAIWAIEDIKERPGFWHLTINRNNAAITHFSDTLSPTQKSEFCKALRHLEDSIPYDAIQVKYQLLQTGEVSHEND